MASFILLSEFVSIVSIFVALFHLDLFFNYSLSDHLLLSLWFIIHEQQFIKQKNIRSIQHTHTARVLSNNQTWLNNHDDTLFTCCTILLVFFCMKCSPTRTHNTQCTCPKTRIIFYFGDNNVKAHTHTVAYT